MCWGRFLRGSVSGSDGCRDRELFGDCVFDDKRVRPDRLSVYVSGRSSLTTLKGGIDALFVAILLDYSSSDT